MIHSSYRFGEYRVDASARELHYRDELAVLSPKVFDCLAYLIDHRDRAIGRDELIAAVWGRVDVSDTLLSQTVLKARRAIGDTGSAQHAIRTIPRFGYRWIAAITLDEPGAAATDSTPGTPPVEASASCTIIPPNFDPFIVAPTLPPPRAASRQRRYIAWYFMAAITVVAMLAFGFERFFTSRTRISAASTAMHAAGAAQNTSSATETSAVLPVDVAAQGEWSWLRLGLMDLIASRMRRAGLPVVPSDNVVALVRDGAGNASAAAKAVVAGTGARFVVLPSASKTENGWNVRLILRAADGSERDTEAGNADVIEAGRTATDRLLALLGAHASYTADEMHDLPVGELLSRAEAALLADDLAGARELLENAPPAWQDAPELRLRLGQIDFRAGQLDPARRQFDALLTEVSAESDPVLRARILNGLGAIEIREDRNREGERDFEEAIALLDKRHDQPALLGQAYTGRAVAFASQTRFDLAAADFSRARIALKLAGDTLALGRVEANEAVVDGKRGRYVEALAGDLRAAQRFKRFGALNEQVTTLANAADAQLMLLRPADALATSDLTWPLPARLEDTSAIHNYLAQRAQVLLANGHVSEARTLLDKLAVDVPNDHDPSMLAYVQTEQARLALLDKRPDQAGALAEAAVAALASRDYQRERVTAWLLLTRALRAQGNDKQAAAEVEGLQGWAKPITASPVAAFAALAGAERDAAQRRNDAAQSGYEQALALADKADVPNDTAEIVNSYGNYLIAEGELEHASAVVGHVARWADRDFACALLAARYYHALGESDAWQSALQSARRLAGERAIPPDLTTAPAASSSARKLQVLSKNR